MGRLVRSEIETRVAEVVGDRTTAKLAVATMVEEVQRALAAGDKVQIMGIGTFEAQVIPARMVRNPATGTKVRAKKSGKVRFRPAEGLREMVAGRRKAPKAR